LLGGGRPLAARKKDASENRVNPKKGGKEEKRGKGGKSFFSRRGRGANLIS